MPNPTIRERIQKVLASFIPRSRVTVLNPLAEQSSLAPSMTAERIHEIIESAKGGDPRDLFALYRDILVSHAHLQGQFQQRKLALLGDPLNVQPRDKTNADDVAAAAAVKSAIDNYRAPNPSDISSCPWLNACSHLLDSTLWPVAMLEKVFKPSTLPGLRYEIGELVLVPEHLLTYQGNNQDYLYQLKVRDTDANGYILGTCKTVDPTRYITHRGHLLSTHDTWGGPMRSLLFWWLLTTMSRDWWSSFLEKYGGAFLVGKYDSGDEDSRSVMERAFSYAVKLGGLVVSKNTEVEVMQAAAGTSGDAYERFIEIGHREMSKLVTGTSLNATSQGSSFGDAGKAKNEEGVRQDIRTLDAALLAQTLEDQFCAQFLRINGLKGRIRLVWGGESPEAAGQLAQLLSNLKLGGFEPDDTALDTISDRLGFRVRRAPAAPAPSLSGLSMLPPAHLLSLASAMDAHIAVDDIARAGAAKLAQAFRGSFAPIRQLILLSKSPHELEESIRRFYPDYDNSRLIPLIEEALTAYAANGAANGVGKSS